MNVNSGLSFYNVRALSNMNLYNKMAALRNNTVNESADLSEPDLSEIQRTRIIPKGNFRPYQETWNSHCSFSGDFDMSDVDEMSDGMAAKLVENGFTYAETPPSEKSADFKKGMAAILAVYKARVPMQAKEINEILKENGIELAEGESYNISVNKRCEITVTGEDSEKAMKIQDILNEESQMGWKLNRLTNIYSKRYDVKDGEEYDRLLFHEMQSESTLRELTDGELSLKDLYMENGRIKGLPPELDELINGTKPDMTDEEKIVYGKIHTVMESVLERGLDNIPDLYTDAVFSNKGLAIN